MKRTTLKPYCKYINNKIIITISLMLTIVILFSACELPFGLGNNTENELQGITEKVYRAFLYNWYYVDVDTKENYLNNFRPNMETLFQYVLLCKQNFDDSLYDEAAESLEGYENILNKYHFVKVEITHMAEMTKEEFEPHAIGFDLYSYDDFEEVLKLDISVEVDTGGVNNNLFDISFDDSAQSNIAVKLDGKWYLIYGNPYSCKLVENYNESASDNPMPPRIGGPGI